MEQGPPVFHISVGGCLQLHIKLPPRPLQLLLISQQNKQVTLLAIRHLSQSDKAIQPEVVQFLDKEDCASFQEAFMSEGHIQCQYEANRKLTNVCHIVGYQVS